MRIFISQLAMDTWMQHGAIALEGEMMRLAVLPSLYMYVIPSVHFVAIDGGSHDPLEIIGSVKTQAELAQMSADHYESSVVIGDHAYTVTPGFQAMPLAQDGTEAQLDPVTWGHIVQTMESYGVV